MSNFGDQELRGDRALVGFGGQEPRGDRALDASTEELQLALLHGQAQEARDVQERAHAAMLQGMGWNPEQYGPAPHPFSTAATLARGSHPFAPGESPPELPEDLRRSTGWSAVNRAREAFQRRILEPMRGFTQSRPGPTAAPPLLSNWQSPASPPGQLLAREPLQAVTQWAARPTSLLGPTVHPSARNHDGSSSDGLNQELIMEEVKRQVQEAMKG